MQIMNAAYGVTASQSCACALICLAACVLLMARYHGSSLPAVVDHTRAAD